MTLLEDTQLLRHYAAEKSEAAFAELVRRHLGPVYAFALRRVGGDAHLAEDVAQIVFTTLARKASALTDRAVLGGWLCRTTHFAARDVVRAERRRRVREQEALIHTMHESSTDDGANIDWEKLQPVLDQTMGELNDDDRDAVWLRFFEGRSFGEVGAKLRLTENAARMRVERALDKLHAALARRGVTSTAAALSVALANQAAASVPAGVAASVTGAALTGAASGGAGTWVAILTMTKIEIGIGAAVIVAIVATGIGDVRANQALRQELAASSTQQEELGRLRAENQQLAAASSTVERQSPDAAELARLRQRAAVLKARPPWVNEAKIKSVAAAKNAGWATADAALETFIWARASGDHETLIGSFAWIGSAKAKADAAFATLGETVRAKYGSADRLAGTVLFGGDARGLGDYRWSRDGALDFAAPATNDPIVSYWADSDPEARNARPGIMLRVRGWAQTASGKERPVIVDLGYAGGHWTMGPSVFSDETWRKIVAQIDPATGALLPAKK